jgi:hypothetical protein
MEDLVELINVISTFEEGTSTQQLCEDTSYRPHIDFEKLDNITRLEEKTY